MRAEDGSHLTAAATVHTTKTCVVCAEPLGSEQWWVVDYPEGVHTRCRDWSAVPYPYQRHIDLLGRMAKALEGEPRELTMKARAWLTSQRSTWPAAGAEGVVRSSSLISRLRHRLSHSAVELRLINQL
jgi:hypothetical protein